MAMVNVLKVVVGRTAVGESINDLYDRGYRKFKVDFLENADVAQVKAWR